MCTLCAPFAPLCTIALRFFQNMVYRTVYKIQIQAFTPNFRSLAQQTKKLGEMCTLCTPCALLCTAARCKWCSMILSKLCHSPEELTLKIWEKSLHRDWNWGLDTPGYHKPSIVQCYIGSKYDDMTDKLWLDDNWSDKHCLHKHLIRWTLIRCTLIRQRFSRMQLCVRWTAYCWW